MKKVFGCIYNWYYWSCTLLHTYFWKILSFLDLCNQNPSADHMWYFVLHFGFLSNTQVASSSSSYDVMWISNSTGISYLSYVNNCQVFWWLWWSREELSLITWVLLALHDWVKRNIKERFPTIRLNDLPALHLYCFG